MQCGWEGHRWTFKGKMLFFCTFGAENEVSQVNNKKLSSSASFTSKTISASLIMCNRCKACLPHLFQLACWLLSFEPVQPSFSLFLHEQSIIIFYLKPLEPNQSKLSLLFCSLLLYCFYPFCFSGEHCLTLCNGFCRRGWRRNRKKKNTKRKKRLRPTFTLL